MRIILTTLLLALCLSACAPAEPSSSAPESEPEVTSGLEVQFDDPAEPPAITATLDSTAIPWEMRPEHWNGSIQCGTDLATGLIKTRYAEIPTAQPGSTVTVTFPEGARPEQVIALAEARDTLGMPVGEGGEMLTLEASLTPGGTLTFALPEFAQDPSCTALLLNVYWGENNAWYALALQTGENAPGPAKALPMFAPGV